MEKLFLSNIKYTAALIYFLKLIKEIVLNTRLRFEIFFCFTYLFSRADKLNGRT